MAIVISTVERASARVRWLRRLARSVVALLVAAVVTWSMSAGLGVWIGLWILLDLSSWLAARADAAMATRAWTTAGRVPLAQTIVAEMIAAEFPDVPGLDHASVVEYLDGVVHLELLPMRTRLEAASALGAYRSYVRLSRTHPEAEHLAQGYRDALAGYRHVLVQRRDHVAAPLALTKARG